MQIQLPVKGPGFPSMEKKVLCLFTGLLQAAEGLAQALEGFSRVPLGCLRCCCFDIYFHPYQCAVSTHRDQTRTLEFPCF